MFHSVDSPEQGQGSARQAWLRLLSRAPTELLELGLGADASVTPDWLRKPEAGLMMVQGRVGGTGEKFNVGEVTVTRCALRLSLEASLSSVGVGYVLGRSHRQAQLVAIADALLQDETRHEALTETLLAPIRAWLNRQNSERAERAQTTRVDFFTVAREASATHTEEDDA
jgi:alpha-D-ribose 1-methylphosphonate 5-triphosphate synthase subunit PhnG